MMLRYIVKNNRLCWLQILFVAVYRFITCKTLDTAFKNVSFVKLAATAFEKNIIIECAGCQNATL